MSTPIYRHSIRVHANDADTNGTIVQDPLSDAPRSAVYVGADETARALSVIADRHAAAGDTVTDGPYGGRYVRHVTTASGDTATYRTWRV
ncbi:hypothetical protein J4U00_gp116 [Mycobacterium phage DyoEdafos]|uniref:Uncharacterized protein n=1 Tax=Mycobacterium phage DyoEdafos TaxID=2599860 RepID=A0A5J6THB1_9CAUD|nr:hypothetical protein J4U00_gp116 [Mycobacterium phage DyoEdafos]QFG10363.1 hypothetical protein SEA_DYOEDAFOS_153 [Mycobacterium phage DyoEdafos]